MDIEKNNILWLILKELEEINENGRTTNKFLHDIKNGIFVEYEVDKDNYVIKKDKNKTEVKYRRGSYKRTDSNDGDN